MENKTYACNTVSLYRRLLLGLALLVGLGLCLQTTTQAGELHLILNGKAIHLTKQPGVSYNESNWGAGFQYDFDEVHNKWVPFITASGFTDSYKNPSYNAGGGVMRRFKFGSGWHFDAGLYAFAMTRKDVKNNEPFLGALPVFSLGTKNIAVNMTYVPKVRPKLAELLFFQLKINTEIFK